MNVTELFEMQLKLDNRIQKEHGLENASLLESKILALLVELGELANETRCFKFWSKKGPAASEVILEEYVDALHFILSIGIEIGVQDKVFYGDQTHKEPTAQFLELYSLIPDLRENRTPESYRNVFSSFLQLGHVLGFTEEAMEASYYKKNEINHKRQDQGY